MGYALVGSLGPVAASLSPAFGQATTAGDLLVAWLGTNSASTTNPFSTTASGWTILPAAGAAHRWVAVAYKPDCGAGETAPVFTATGAPSVSYSMLGEFSGGALSSVADQAGAGTGSTTQTAQCTAPDGQAGDLIVGIALWNSPATAVTFTDSMTDTTGAAVTVNSVHAQPGGANKIAYDYAWGIAGGALGAAGDKFTSAVSSFSSGSSAIASFKPAAAAAPPLGGPPSLADDKGRIKKLLYLAG